MRNLRGRFLSLFQTVRQKLGGLLILWVVLRAMIDALGRADFIWQMLKPFQLCFLITALSDAGLALYAFLLSPAVTLIFIVIGFALILFGGRKKTEGDWIGRPTVIHTPLCPPDDQRAVPATPTAPRTELPRVLRQPEGPPPSEKLNIIYGESEKGMLYLKFAPDTRAQEDADVILLLVYGYKLLRQLDEVPVKDLFDSLVQSGVRRRYPDTTYGAMERFIHGTNMMPDLDGIAASYLSNRLLYKGGLARGGIYKITNAGISRANYLLADMIERA